MEGTRESIESRALRKSYKVFKTSIDPDNLVTMLYTNELLTPDEKSKSTQRTLTDGQKLEEMFSSLERRVSADPKHFHGLVTVLEGERTLKSVAKRLKGQLFPYSILYLMSFQTGWGFRTVPDNCK